MPEQQISKSSTVSTRLKRGLLIVDVSNLYYTVRKNFHSRARLDYGKFVARFHGQVEIGLAIAYGAEMRGAAGSFKSALQGLGFQTKYKEPKVFSGPEGKQTRKADWDVGMAMDAVRYAKDFDVLILATADGDLSPCVEYIRELGVEVWIIGCGISRDLKDLADYWEELQECDLLDNPTSGRVRQPL